jgi:starch synthase
MLTFESKTTRKVGGLAEVPPELARNLAGRSFETTLVTPSHGLRIEGGVVFEEEIGGFKYRVLATRVDGLDHYIVEGGLFESSDVYGGDLPSKALVFARVVKGLFEKSLKEGLAPDVVHAHDWHSGLSLVGLNSLIVKEGLKPRLVYHIHLLSKAWFKREDLEAILSGRLVKGVYGVRDFSEYYNFSQGFADKLIPLLADRTITVSVDYGKTVEKWVGLKHRVMVGVVPNGSSWNPGMVSEYVEKIAGARGVEDRALTRRVVLRELCSKNVAELGEEWYKTLRSLGVDAGSDTWHQCFEEDGDLVLSTGRISRQKGFEVLLKALEKTIVRNPRLRLLLMVIPVPGSESLIEKMVRYLRVYERNLKIVFGRVPKSLYVPAHHAARVYVAPSLYEPFGLVALEAMASGTPVLASDTGGFKTTVLDWLR